MKKLLSLCVILIGLGGCIPIAYPPQTVILPVSNKSVDFVFYNNGKDVDGVDHKGVTVWDQEGKLVYDSAASGKSLTGIGIEAAASLGGALGGAALLRPDRHGGDSVTVSQEVSKGDKRSKRRRPKKKYKPKCKGRYHKCPSY